MGTEKWLGVLLIETPNCYMRIKHSNQTTKEAEKPLEAFVKLGIKKHT